MTDINYGNQLTLSYELFFTNSIGETSSKQKGTQQVAYQPYVQKELEGITLEMPRQSGLGLITLQLSDAKGTVLNRNFMHVEILSDEKLPRTEIISIKPDSFSNASFSKKQWNVLDGLKVNGAGEGYFEYTIPVDKSVNLSSVKEAYFLVELSAKELYVKDQETKEKTDVNFMLGARASASGNPNSYPMTDEKLFSSSIVISVNGEKALTTTLPDDPADHRGVVSWHHQLKDKKLREAGSYGYLTKVPISKKQLKSAGETGKLVVQIKTVGDGGIAVYGKSFGRYPLDPSLVLKLR